MFPVLETLIALQALDSAADAARRRLTELPAAEQAIDKQIAAALADVERARASLAANQHARRELEKQVATVDARLARFEDHKAAEPSREPDVDLEALNDALRRLETLDDRQVRIVEMRYFAGLTMEEIAHVLGLSLSAVEKDWRMARNWLKRELAA